MRQGVLRETFTTRPTSGRRKTWKKPTTALPSPKERKKPGKQYRGEGRRSQETEEGSSTSLSRDGSHPMAGAQPTQQEGDLGGREPCLQRLLGRPSRCRAPALGEGGVFEHGARCTEAEGGYCAPAWNKTSQCILAAQIRNKKTKGFPVFPFHHAGLLRSVPKLIGGSTTGGISHKNSAR